MFRETKARSILKTFSWRILATLTTTLLVYIFTKRIKIALAIGAVEFAAKIIIYFFHERLWNKISFGRKDIMPFVIWFTGLPSSGKAEFADAVCKTLSEKSFKVERLHGSKIRGILPRTGFSKEDRDKHIKRVGLLANILENNKIVVVASFVSPYQEARNFVRKICDNFIEIYMNTPLRECQKRDKKGLYKKAKEGLLSNFTGIDGPYEPPQNPELVIDASRISLDEGVKKILDYLDKKDLLR
ncbi:MAG: adenylyl-sulfate kinase [Omnitrophica bacterium]|nr:adenylyl-sulfate kinase [Candidatus Omnitrophota bacterium]